MHFWHSAPFIRILFPCLAAIFCGIYLPLTAELCLWLLIGLTVAWFIFIRFRKDKDYSKRWRSGIFIQLLFFFFFLWHSIQYDERQSVNHFSRFRSTKSLVLRVCSEPELRNKNWKCIAEVKGVLQNDSLHLSTGHILLYIKNEGSKPALGDIFTSFATAENIKGPFNEAEFDYRQYLAFRNVFHQLHLHQKNSVQSGFDAAAYPIRISISIRDYFIDVFRKYIPGDTELGVAEALIFGYKADLDQETVQAYSNTGTLHVLAVSGLHVGIVFIVLAKLLGFMNRERRLRIIQALIIILFLWLYALITGFSASVVRAALMFTLIIFGKMINRRANIFNSVAASAFLLLVWNPYYLMDVGFQLSYMAVLGIIYLQPLILPLWEAPNAFLHSVWSLTVVSIAAQIGTLPISLYYFHQFPVYFLISNLLIIPISNVVVYIGLLLLALSFHPYLAAICGKLISMLIYFTNQIVLFLEKMPGALLENIYFNVWQMILLLSLIIFILSWLALRRQSFLQLSLLSTLLIYCIDLQHFMHVRSTEKLLFHHVSGYTVVEYQKGEESLLFSNPDFEKQSSRQRYHLANGWLLRGVKKRSWTTEALIPHNVTGLSLISLGGQSIAILDSSFQPHQLNRSKLEVDYLILSRKCRVSIPRITNYIRPECIIADASSAAYKIKYWQKEARDLSIPFHSTHESGALVKDMSR